VVLLFGPPCTRRDYAVGDHELINDKSVDGAGNGGAANVMATEVTTSRDWDEEYDADIDDEVADNVDETAAKTDDKEEGRRYNAFICSRIDQTWVSIREIRWR